MAVLKDLSRFQLKGVADVNKMTAAEKASYYADLAAKEEHAAKALLDSVAAANAIAHERSRTLPLNPESVSSTAHYFERHGQNTAVLFASDGKTLINFESVRAFAALDYLERTGRTAKTKTEPIVRADIAPDDSKAIERLCAENVPRFTPNPGQACFYVIANAKLSGHNGDLWDYESPYGKAKRANVLNALRIEDFDSRLADMVRAGLPINSANGVVAYCNKAAKGKESDYDKEKKERALAAVAKGAQAVSKMYSDIKKEKRTAKPDLVLDVDGIEAAIRAHPDSDRKALRNVLEDILAEWESDAEQAAEPVKVRANA